MDVLSPEYIKALEDWLFINEAPESKRLIELSKKIPAKFRSYSGPIYRGMFVDDEFVEQLNNGGVVFKNASSWTTDFKIADKFTRDPAYKTVSGKGKRPVILKRKMKKGDIGVNIANIFAVYGTKLLDAGLDDLSYDSAMNEKEVLVNGGYKLMPLRVKESLLNSLIRK